MNRSAMTAFADTIVFMTVIMMAVSVTVLTSLPETEDGISPDSFLDMISGTEIRLSDMTDLDDDALINLPDALAYSLEHESSVSDYLTSLLDSIYGPGRYCLSYTFEEIEATLGEQRDYFQSSATKDASVSVGGHISMKLSIYK